MQRITVRTLPDGNVRHVQPFHVCIKGLETAVLCRDDQDYDMMVKTICVTAWRKNVIVIIYAVVSNHSHIAVLAAKQQDADNFGIELKKIYSMWFSGKYRERKILRHVEVKALCLDNDWYVRNALAYIPRNALDNGSNVNEYPWSGYNAMFCTLLPSGRNVCSMTKREIKQVLHTKEDLSMVKWQVDGSGKLVPFSFCDHAYLEQAFNNDQAFFLKTIGGLNAAEMHYAIEEKPYQMLPDAEFIKAAEEVSQRWFAKNLVDLSLDRKNRLIPYLYRTMKTSIPQLSRVTGLSRDIIARMLTRPNPGVI